MASQIGALPGWCVPSLDSSSSICLFPISNRTWSLIISKSMRVRFSICLEMKVESNVASCFYQSFYTIRLAYKSRIPGATCNVYCGRYVRYQYSIEHTSPRNNGQTCCDPRRRCVHFWRIMLLLRAPGLVTLRLSYQVEDTVNLAGSTSLGWRGLDSMTVVGLRRPTALEISAASLVQK